MERGRATATVEYVWPYAEKWLVWAVVVEYLLLVVANLVWNWESAPLYRNDAAIHALNALRMGTEGSHVIGNSASVLFYWLCHLVVVVFGASTKAPFFIIEATSLAVAAWGAYLAAKEVRSPLAGYFAATLVLMSLQSSVALRTFFVDYVVGALFVLMWLFYLRSKRLRSKFYTAAFFLVVTVTLLMRAHSFICLAPFLSAISFDLWSECQVSLNRTVLTAIAVCLIPVAGLYYACTAFSDAGPVFLGFLALQYSLICGLLCLLNPSLKASHFARYIILLAVTGLVVALVHVFVNGSGVVSSLVDTDVRLDGRAFVFVEWQNNLVFASDWLRGLLLELRNKPMGPILFWLYVGSFCLTVWSPSRRRRFLPILACTATVPVFFAIFTCDDVRYNYPVVCLACLLVADCLPLLRRLSYLPIAAYVLAWLAFGYGWMLPLGLPEVEPILVHNELTYNNYGSQHLYDAQIARLRSVDTGHAAAKVVPCPANSLPGLLSWGSAWHWQGLFFTVPPYHTVWERLAPALGHSLPQRAWVLTCVKNRVGRYCDIDLMNGAEMATFLDYAFVRYCPEKKLRTLEYHGEWVLRDISPAPKVVYILRCVGIAEKGNNPSASQFSIPRDCSKRLWARKIGVNTLELWQVSVTQYLRTSDKDASVHKVQGGYGRPSSTVFKELK